MKKGILILAIAITALISPAFCTETKHASIEKHGLSFEQAYELMIANNNAIKATYQEIEVKKYEKRAAVGHFLPKVVINTTATHFDGDIQVDKGTFSLGSVIPPIPLGQIKLQDQNLLTASGGVIWNIFTGGKIIAMNSAARAKLEATNEKYKQITNELTIELVKRYYGLRLAEDLIEVRKQVLETTQKHLSNAIKLEKEGIISTSERLHADVAYAQAKRDFEAATRDRNIIEEGLKSLIKADDVDLSNVSITTDSELFIYKKDMDTLNEFKELAIKENPQLKQLDAKQKLAQANYVAKAASYSPTVSLFAYDIFASKNQSYQMPSYAVGGSVNWVLFDGLSRFNELKAANHLREQVKYEQANARNNIRSLVTKKYEEVLKNKEQYDSSNAAIKSANEAQRTAILAFDEGLGTSLEVTDAQTALLGVKIQRLNSIYNYDVALVELLSTHGSAEEILEYIKESAKERL
ncbi:MAG: TolC family protein [bacterium]|nr:TolC family protein [bacterium]